MSRPSALRFTLLFILSTILLSYLCVSNATEQKKNVQRLGEESTLPRLNIERNGISVSGLSSGAFMSVQFQIAFSSAVKGVGVIAGGPYFCSRADLSRARGLCMSAYQCDQINVDALIDDAKGFESKGTIDSLKNVQKHQVYLFSGKSDTIVASCVMKQLLKQYQALGVSDKQIMSRFDMAAEHAMITDKYGNSCGHNGSPYINNCAYSAARDLLQHIYSETPLKPEVSPVSSNIHSFGQKNYTKVTPHTISMDEEGFVYIPTACKDGKTACKLHVVFHGCDQYKAKLGTEYVEKAGYLEVAEANNIVLLFPQTVSSWFGPQNILGCWDWWGYNEAAYATKEGSQMKAIAAMIAAISGF